MHKLSMLATAGLSLALANPALAEEEQLQDMSDPLAVYTQAGAGYTNKGLNVKVGQTHDTGVPTTMAMTVLELKGAGGESLGWDNDATNSLDSFRVRQFEADMTNGRGTQLDLNYDLNNEAGTFSYSFIQALPKLGPVQFYPLAGAGVAFGNNVMGDNGEVISGYSVPGTFALVGTYAKIDITDKIWLNYNPMWMSTLSGSETYKSFGFAGESQIFLHEAAASYQINPRLNVRYFANWSEHQSFVNGDHRIEFNYQF